MKALIGRQTNLMGASHDPSVSLERSDETNTVFDVANFLSQHGRLPSLDGWRALSIAIVIGSHVPHMTHYAEESRFLHSIVSLGEFGVDIFLVLSGFLITYLLLLERQKDGAISLKGFYLRRIFRILPLYSSFLLVVWFISLSTALEISNGQWLRLITFTTNYPSGEITPFPIGHIWSLSVEEQFYLIWPALFLFTLHLRKPAIWTFLGISLFILIPPVARVIGYFGLGGGITGYHAFLTRCDSIAWGSLLAAACVFRGGLVEQILAKYSRHLLTFAFISVGIVLFCLQNFLLGPIMLPFGRTLLGMSVAIAIIISIRNYRRPIFAWLNWKPVMFVGVLSYSLYIWQQLFVTRADIYGLDSTPWFLTPEFFIFPLFGVAYFMHRFVEQPFLKLKTGLLRKAPGAQLLQADEGLQGKAPPSTTVSTSNEFDDGR